MLDMGTHFECIIWDCCMGQRMRCVFFLPVGRLKWAASLERHIDLTAVLSWRGLFPLGQSKESELDAKLLGKYFRNFLIFGLCWS